MLARLCHAQSHTPGQEMNRLNISSSPTTNQAPPIRIRRECASNYCNSAMARILLCLMILLLDPVVGNTFMHSLPSLSATANIPASEMSALYDLYNATTGANWFWSDDTATNGIPWNFTDLTANNPCVDHWQGIRCSFTRPFEYFHVIGVSLSSFNLVGSLPNTLVALSQLTTLDFGSNSLTGTIPVSVCDLVQLKYLELENNFLTGRIPESLGNLKQLRYIFLYHNQLAGTIPNSLGSLVHLLYLLLFENMLTGTMPESLGNLNQLQYFDLASNRLTGPLPALIGNLTLVIFLLLNDNLLTGSIPASLGNLTQVTYIYMYQNQFTGALPESLGNLVQLKYLDFNPNLLTGTIPEALGNLAQLEYLNLNDNQLSGTMPSMANPHLEQLFLSNNRLSGNIPSLARLPRLQSLLLQNNYLHGSIDNVFNPSTQPFIVTIVLANNQLTGTLPKEVFQLNLQTFVGTSNCFEGPLPTDTICNNLDMVSFVIDGMSSASSCRNKLFSKPFSAYSLHQAIDGSIPTCLFQLPNITTLHLSGNGFTGSIPSNIQLSNTLTDLSLSHNALTGNIPSQIQLKKWSNIDLSYNRMSGTLRSNFATNGTIELENNRISGAIPGSFRTILSLSILGTNTFACDYDQSDLPEHDPNRGKYQCGSNIFNVLIYVWLGAIVGAAMVSCYNRQTNRSILVKDAMLHGTNLYKTMIAICRLSLCCALYSLVVLLPLYAICSVAYGTQTYAYAYQVAAVYMSGIVPFALDWCFWWILLMGFNAMVLYAPAIAGTISNNITEQKQENASTLRQSMRTIVPYIVIDCIVVAGVNAAYVYVAVYKSSSLLLLLQTILSIFKVVWGRWALPYILAALAQRSKYGKIQVLTQIAVNLLNNIVIPCLIVAVVSPDCFYNALVAAPTVYATVFYRNCVVAEAATGLCIQYEEAPLLTSYDPPFTYNYQCSSSLVTYYAPAFVSMCIVSTFLMPIVQYVFQRLDGQPFATGTFCHRLLHHCRPRLADSTNDANGASDRSVLNIDGLLTTLIGTLGLILTFGVMFPPLCVAFTVSICAMVFFFRYSVGRFISSSTQQISDTTILEAIKAECNSVDGMRILKDSVWLLITVSCWFYTLFLFDTLGDAVGFEGAYWVLIVMPLMPLVLYALYRVVCKYYPSTYMQRHYTGKGWGKEGPPGQKVNLEMQSINSADAHNVLVTEMAGDNNDEIERNDLA